VAVGKPPETVSGFIDAFIAAWPDAEATVLSRFFSEDASYHNGPLEPVRGRSAVLETVGQMMTLGGVVDVEIVHLLADGPIVMTERVDHWRSGQTSASLRVAGVFEIHDGVIASWRDYFDLDEFSSQRPDAG
jgi:limonene-1,2-epoxide hydrolase